VRGPLRLSGITGAVVVAAATVDGPLELTNSATTGGAALVTGNTIRGPLRCSGNTSDPVNLEIPNTVSGPRTGQCTAL
jgi:hypothetical protein